jgi:hypothetical protein
MKQKKAPNGTICVRRSGQANIIVDNSYSTDPRQAHGGGGQ